MEIREILSLRKDHLNRLSNTYGASGERLAIEVHSNWIQRPKGEELTNILSVLEEKKVVIKRSSFDAIAIPSVIEIDFKNCDSIREHIDSFIFIEIKTTNKASVNDDFSGYFFAFTEGELSAAEQLGERHRVALVNKRTEHIIMSSVPELIARAKSLNWQVSVQL
ncbi:hypothetical protein QNE88_000430 [Vibrio alginolyticus]|nr:hypothetical protein [Vibrio alginolyticus]ELB2808530.1 hypothetical protein [Vibrio alginolyticus]